MVQVVCYVDLLSHTLKTNIKCLLTLLCCEIYQLAPVVVVVVVVVVVYLLIVVGLKGCEDPPQRGPRSPGVSE